MKLSIPKTPAEYFQKTEHAVRSAYGGLHSCWTYYQQGLQHTSVFEPPKTREDQARLDRGLELVGKYFDVKITEAMFSGLILRTAYMAIRLYSRNKTIPPSCAMLVKPSQKSAIPFCIGKERHGIPAGLIIFAGRNQYNHWDEDRSHPTTREIFDALSRAFWNISSSDLAFDLSNPTIPIYAHEILVTALGWDSYEKYLGEMTELLP